MGGKHLKRVRAEKSKVHLKKKILPKGQNITQTTFTVKKIVALEQLRKIDENEPVSSWNVPLKDLLVRLRHYNFNSRLNSLAGIKELLKKNPEILKGPYLKSIIERILELVTDVEHKVRMTAINILSVIFDLIHPNSLKPFYGILIVHLGCAMTHRSASVQLDSIKYIDLLIKYSPEALKHNFISLTKSFARIVKNYLHESHCGVLFSKGSQNDLDKLKAEVLFRFYQFLSAGLYSGIVKQEILESKDHNVNIIFEQSVPLRGANDHYKQIPSLSLLSNNSINKEKTMTENDSDEFQSLCLVVVPLLFDTWTEFSSNLCASECVLSQDIGALLLVILKILLLLYEKTVALNDPQMECWFISNFSPKFEKYFTSNFPYLPTPSKRCEISHFGEFSEGSCNDFHLQNLIICFLSYSFKIVSKKSQLETKMENYLINALLKKSQTEVEMLLKVTEVVIHASKYKKPSFFLSKVVAALGTTNNPELQHGLSNVVMEITLKRNNYNYVMDQCILQWMKSIPECLCKSQIFEQEIKNILKLVNKPIGNEILKELELKGKDIMMNLPKIKIEGAPQLQGQKLIANILFRCNNKVLEELVKNRNLTNTLYPPELKNYILDIFSQKLKIKQME